MHKALRIFVACVLCVGLLSCSDPEFTVDDLAVQTVEIMNTRGTYFVVSFQSGVESGNTIWVSVSDDHGFSWNVKALCRKDLDNVFWSTEPLLLPPDYKGGNLEITVSHLNKDKKFTHEVIMPTEEIRGELRSAIFNTTAQTFDSVNFNVRTNFSFEGVRVDVVGEVAKNASSPSQAWNFLAGPATTIQQRVGLKSKASRVALIASKDGISLVSFKKFAN